MTLAHRRGRALAHLLASLGLALGGMALAAHAQPLGPHLAHNAHLLPDQRDVPHIYAYTATEAFYALGYHQASQHHAAIRTLLLASRGLAHRQHPHLGPWLDEVAWRLRARQIAPRQWRTQVPPTLRQALNAWLTGVQTWATHHPQLAGKPPQPAFDEVDLATALYLDQALLAGFGEAWWTHTQAPHQPTAAQAVCPATLRPALGGHWLLKQDTLHLGLGTPLAGPLALMEATLHTSDGLAAYLALPIGLPVPRAVVTQATAWASTLAPSRQAGHAPVPPIRRGTHPRFRPWWRRLGAKPLQAAVAANGPVLVGAGGQAMAFSQEGVSLAALADAWARAGLQATVAPPPPAPMPLGWAARPHPLGGSPPCTVQGAALVRQWLHPPDSAAFAPCPAQAPTWASRRSRWLATPDQPGHGARQRLYRTWAGNWGPNEPASALALATHLAYDRRLTRGQPAEAPATWLHALDDGHQALRRRNLPPTAPLRALLHLTQPTGPSGPSLAGTPYSAPVWWLARAKGRRSPLVADAALGLVVQVVWTPSGPQVAARNLASYPTQTDGRLRELVLVRQLRNQLHPVPWGLAACWAATTGHLALPSPIQGAATGPVGQD